jgi:hypothetical protein
MKFYGNGIVWDAIKNKPLCKFINGEYETNDNECIEKLIQAGYEHERSEKTIQTQEPAKTSQKQETNRNNKSRGR